MSLFNPERRTSVERDEGRGGNIFGHTFDGIRDDLHGLIIAVHILDFLSIGGNTSNPF